MAESVVMLVWAGPNLSPLDQLLQHTLARTASNSPKMGGDHRIIHGFIEEMVAIDLEEILNRIRVPHAPPPYFIRMQSIVKRCPG